MSDPNKGSDDHKASSMIAVEVNTEGDVCMEAHDDSDEEKVTSPGNNKHGSGEGVGDADADGEEEGSATTITEASDLSDPSRRVWIVTTAGLPWMTGTAVNPLLRALSLAEHRGKDRVTLVIPWLPSAEARRALYGASGAAFGCPADQEAWIRRYCVERCNCTAEHAAKLRIRFWKGFYQESFGSIFPVDDICSTIPRDEADICILEEPEHLNWFRVPATPKTKPAQRKGGGGSSGESEQGSTSPNQEQEQEREQEKNEDGDGVKAEEDSKSDGCSDDDIEILGWSHKFRHVVGILHTNYADYIRQYGMASMVTAPALNSLSSLVVKAYCHKVIRLSATLPHLDATKEVTCNVHGVRHEFLERPVEEPEAPQEEEADAATVSDDGDDAKSSAASSDAPSKVEDATTEAAPVYFIGKLIWAKGFEYVLEVQEKFRAATGEYFAIDIYGGGKDEKEIQTAFFGRNGASRASSTVSQNSDSSSVSAAKEADKKAAFVFGTSSSLRDQICGGDITLVDDDYVLVVNTDQEAEEETAISATAGNVTPPDSATSITELLATPNAEDVEAEKIESHAAVDELSGGTPVPLEVLGDLSEKTLNTSVDTADAALKLIESVMKAGFDALVGGKDGAKKRDVGDTSASPKKALPFHIAPAKTRFKWRRSPVPARFLGVQDHILVRDISEHKIFLNMSTSEVLCTTSAEALAMGKFVILPKHPSNDFFLQFPNCLAYETMDECVLKLKYALENTPKPLSETHAHALSWEGATERLIKASAITKREEAARKEKGLDIADTKAAQFHVDAGKRSDWLRAKILK